MACLQIAKELDKERPCFPKNILKPRSPCVNICFADYSDYQTLTVSRDAAAQRMYQCQSPPNPGDLGCWKGN